MHCNLNDLAEADRDLRLRFQLNLSCFSLSTGVEVPLGYFLRDNWTPVELVEIGCPGCIPPDFIAMWLTDNPFLGWTLENADMARKCVDGTLARCRALASAKARAGGCN